MVSVSYNGTVYEGRLVSINALTEEAVDERYSLVVRNIGYSVVLVDAFGATIKLCVMDLRDITFK